MVLLFSCLFYKSILSQYKLNTIYNCIIYFISWKHLFLCNLIFFVSVSLQLKRKSARVASLEQQLQEKTSAYSQAALSNTELENQLLVQHPHLNHRDIRFTRHDNRGQKNSR